MGDENTHRQFIDALREMLGLEPLFDKRSEARFDQSWLGTLPGRVQTPNRIEGVDK
jgi:hypothetical protein